MSSFANFLPFLQLKNLPRRLPSTVNRPSMPTALTIVFVGCTIFMSHWFATLFARTKIPDVLWLFLIGLLIGPGGKTIRAIQEETGAKLDVMTQALRDAAANPAKAAPRLLIDCSELVSLDTTGLDALRSLAELARSLGGSVSLQHLREQPLSLLQRAGAEADFLLLNK